MASGTIRTWWRRSQIIGRYADPCYRLQHGDADLSAPVTYLLANPALRLRSFGSSTPDRLSYFLRKGGTLSNWEAQVL